MVERLKAAIEKAREQRHGIGPVDSERRAPVPSPAAEVGWTRFSELALDPERMRRERIVTGDKSDSAHAAFDMLRTRLVKVARENGWRRIGVTSPTQGCGKTVVSINLALSVVRNPSLRAMLIDLDLRRPNVARCFGDEDPPAIAPWLAGDTSDEAHLRRVGQTLLVAMNGRHEADSAEIMQSPATVRTFAQSINILKPDLAIFDLPPLLVGDDAIGFAPHLDGVLLVVAAGSTRPADVTQCERLLKGATELIGVVLNKDETAAPLYDYHYG